MERSFAPTNTDLYSSPLQLFPPDLSLVMVWLVMTRCSALQFSQAFTFLGNGRLLVTTVHLGACKQLSAHEHPNLLSGGSSQHEQSEKFLGQGFIDAIKT